MNDITVGEISSTVFFMSSWDSTLFDDIHVVKL